MAIFLWQMHMRLHSLIHTTGFLLLVGTMTLTSSQSTLLLIGFERGVFE